MYENYKILVTVFIFVVVICLFSTFSKFSNAIFVYAKGQESEDVFDEQVQIDTIEMMTANGSYIDGEGNVYLVEEDIEAYLNDTLTFYKKMTI